MPNPDAAAAVVDGLRNGFLHPGDPKRGIKPTPIVLPLKGNPGEPKEMTDLLDATTKLLSECIVAAIEKDFELVPRKEAKALRRAAGKGAPNPISTPVFCRCNLDEPLTYLTITDPEAIVLDGGALIRGLANRDPQCPHRITS